jgi:hypothetical protein
LWRPLLAGATALLLVDSIAFSVSKPLVALAFNLSLSVTTYLVALALLWVIAGRPQGAETAVTNFVLRRA